MENKISDKIHDEIVLAEILNRAKETPRQDFYIDLTLKQKQNGKTKKK